MRCGIYVRVSTDDQRDNGYSIDSQLRMIKEYCEKNEYDIVDIYNDAGHSGKDLMRPEMQRLLKDIKSKNINKLVAIKIDRLTRNNYDGFWLLNYCETIINEVTWNATRNVLVKNKHSNYGEYIHLFSGLVKCPICGDIMSSSESFKYPNGKQKVYYHLRCKNHNCSGFGLHYNTEKIETKLKQVLEELTLFMLSMDNEIITCNSTKSDDVKDIEKAIEKLKLCRLVKHMAHFSENNIL